MDGHDERKMTMTEEPSMLPDDMPDVVNALAASPDFRRDGICFAARNTGLYRSDDSGKSWQPLYGSLDLTAPLATTSVAVSPVFSSDQTVFAGVNGGILRSANGGTTWEAIVFPAPASLVTTLAVSPNYIEDGIVIAGTMEDGVFRSSDRGRIWAAWNFGLLDLSVFCVALSPDFAHDETLFAGTLSGLFRSTNGSRAWREVDFPTDLAPVLCLAASPQYTSDGLLFAGTESNGLFASNDRGHSWTQLDDDALTGAVNGIVLAPQFPAQPDILVLLHDALVVSRDHGQSWSEWRPGLQFDLDTASIAAPHGLEPHAPLLIGLIDGSVVCL